MPLAQVLISYWLFENTTALSSTAVFINVLNSALFNWTNGGGSITVSSQEFALTAHIRGVCFVHACVVCVGARTRVCEAVGVARVGGCCCAFRSACASLCASDLINNGLAFTAVLFVIIAFSFIPASFAVFVVKEREVNAKHQQVCFPPLSACSFSFVLRAPTPFCVHVLLFVVVHVLTPGVRLSSSSPVCLSPPTGCPPSRGTSSTTPCPVSSPSSSSSPSTSSSLSPAPPSAQPSFSSCSTALLSR